jgi:hypothetical protein
MCPFWEVSIPFEAGGPAGDGAAEDIRLRTHPINPVVSPSGRGGVEGGFVT